MSALARLLSFAVLIVAQMRTGSAQSLEIESFASLGARGAVVAGSTWAPAGNVMRLPDAIVVAGSALDDNGWGARALQLDLRAMNYVTISASRGVGNLAGFLVFQLEDAALRTHTVAVPTSQFGVGVMTAVQVPLGTWSAGFDASAVTGWSFGGGTTGLLAFRLTLDQIGLTFAAVGGIPTISVQPVDRLIGVGEGTTLTVAATGGQPFTYRWTGNGTVIGGATGPTLALVDVSSATTGDYQVEVTNAAGTVASRAASVVVVNLFASQSLGAGAAAGYEPGSTVTVSTTLTHAGNLGSVGLQVVLPAGWTFGSDSGSAADPRPAGGATGLAEWRWSSLPASSPFTFSYTLVVPSTAREAQVLSAALQVTQGTLAAQIAVQPAPLVIAMAAHPHTADLNRDYRISLLELTRVIELYNTRNGTVRTGAYRIASAPRTEDGFTADVERIKGSAGSVLSSYHSADSDRDGTLGLNELLRLIQIYNYRTLDQVRTGQYRIVSSGSEDGYEPGP